MGNPEQYYVADWFISSQVFERLHGIRDTLKKNGISYSMVCTERAVLMSHRSAIVGKDENGKLIRSHRQQANDVRATVQVLPAVWRGIQSSVCWTRFDLLVILKEGVTPSSLAAALIAADNIELYNVVTKERVFPTQRVVAPPQLFVHCPVSVPHNVLCGYVSQFGGVTSLEPEAGHAGTSTITFVNPKSAHLAAGIRTFIRGCGELVFTTGDRDSDKLANDAYQGKMKDLLNIETRIAAAKPLQMLTAISTLAMEE